MNCYECDYIAVKWEGTPLESKMHVIDWIWTGGELSPNSIGHFWATMGFTISNQSYRLVDNQPQANAIIEFLN